MKDDHFVIPPSLLQEFSKGNVVCITVGDATPNMDSSVRWSYGELYGTAKVVLVRLYRGRQEVSLRKT